MSLHHFLLSEQVVGAIDEPEFMLGLSRVDAKHARVLRLAPGEHVSVCDAAHDYFELEVLDASEGLKVRVAQRLDAPKPCASLTLFQGMAKGDKMDDIVRHATEVGIDAFVPLACSRSVAKLDAKKAATRLARWQAVAHSAAMQAGRMLEPCVGMPETVKQAASRMGAFDCVLVCWEECAATKTIPGALHAALQNLGAEQVPKIAVVVGPEGGLSPEEVDLLCKEEHAHPVTLGPSILRTETAGVVAPALVMYACGGMGAAERGF